MEYWSSGFGFLKLPYSSSADMKESQKIVPEVPTVSDTGSNDWNPSTTLGAGA
jgi:hypothetical protein